jgi:hypothetical protein
MEAVVFIGENCWVMWCFCCRNKLRRRRDLWPLNPEEKKKA